MLVLTRRKAEEIIITAPDGTRIVVTLVEQRPAHARIGITAPREWRIVRAELEQRDQETQA